MTALDSDYNKCKDKNCEDDYDKEDEDASIYVCTYLLEENTNTLLESNYEFLVHIFWEAAIGSTFIFLETTHRIWPDMVDAAIRLGVYLRVNPCCCCTTTLFKDLKNSEHESR